MEENSLSTIETKGTKEFQKSRKTLRSPTRKRKERDSEADMEEIAKMLKNLTLDITELKKDMRSGNDDLKKSMEENNLQMKSMIEETRKEIAEIKEKEKVWNEERKQLMQALKTKETDYTKEIERSHALENRIAQLENRGEREEKEKRRNNIVIKGKEFNENHLQKEVQEFVKKFLEVDVDIKEAYKNKTGKIVKVKLETWGQKTAVMKAKHKLRQINEEIYIDNDLTITEGNIQREIRKIAEEERKKGSYTKIGYQKLKINNKWFVWEKEMHTLKEQEMESQPKN